MVRRLLQGGQELIVWDRSAEAVKPHAAKGVRGQRRAPFHTCWRAAARITGKEPPPLSVQSAWPVGWTRSAQPPYRHVTFGPSIAGWR